MRRAGTRGGDGLGALRRERSPFAALGVLLLFVQLLLSGFTQGAMAAERLAAPDLGLICHTAEAANDVAPGSVPSEPDRHCPCLAGVCVAASAAIIEGGDGIDPTPPIRAAIGSPLPDPTGATPRPFFDLFARAGRGPPTPV